MKKILAIIVALTFVFALTVPAMADAEDSVLRSVGFHCGGSVTKDITNYVKGELVELVRVDATTWELVGDEYVCPNCGRTDWISYSNNNGVPDGKNVQLVHKQGGTTGFQGNVAIMAGATLTTTTKTITEVWQKEYTPWETWKEIYGNAYSSVTATNTLGNIFPTLNPKNGSATTATYAAGIGVVPNSNHFTYATLDRAALAAGVDLNLVVGNNFDIVGKMNVKLVGGNLELTFIKSSLDKFSFGAVAFNNYNANFPKNGNIHSQKEADLKSQLGATTGFNHNNVSVIPCPAGNTIYLYVHFANLQYFDKYELAASGTCKVRYLRSSNASFSPDTTPVDVVVKLFADADLEDEIELEFVSGAWAATVNLAAGTYYIAYYDSYLEQTFTETIVVPEVGVADAVGYFANHSTNAADITVKNWLRPITNPMGTECICGKC